MKSTKPKATYRSAKPTSTFDKLRSLSTPIKLIAGVLSIVIISALGTWGYSVYKARELQAQALGVTPVLNTSSGINVSMCKRSQGDIAAVRVYFIARNTSERPETRVKVYDFSKGGYIGDVKNSGWLFGAMYTTVFTKTSASVGASYPGFKSKLYTVSYLQDCP